MTGDNLCDVSADTIGMFLFAPRAIDDSNNSPSDSHVFHIDSKSGALTQVNGSPFTAAVGTIQPGCVAAVVNGQ